MNEATFSNEYSMPTELPDSEGVDIGISKNKDLLSPLVVSTRFIDDSHLADPLKAYFQEMRRIEIFSDEDQLALGVHIDAARAIEGREPDAEAKKKGVMAEQRLVESHMAFAVDLARRYQHRGLELIDLIQEAHMGLVLAAKDFSYKEGRFSTFAKGRVEWTVKRAIKTKARTIVLPEHIEDEIGKIARARQIVEQRIQREASTTEIAEEMGVTPEKVEDRMYNSQAISYLESTVDESGSFIEGIGYDVPAEEDVLETVLGNLHCSTENDMVNWMAGFLSDPENLESQKILSTKELTVLRARFGFEDGIDYTLEEIGDRYTQSREAIRKNQVNGLRKLAGYWEEKVAPNILVEV